MKQNNCDIAGYQFFLVKPSGRYIEGASLTDRFMNIQKEISGKDRYSDYRLIPFEEVDGLTIKDLDSIVHGEIFIACFVNIPSLKRSIYHSTILYNVFTHTEADKKTKEETSIDGFVTERLRAKYHSASPSQKRVYDCFFARYSDEAYVKQKD